MRPLRRVDDRPVVVGVDGSPASLAALTALAHDALRTGSAVHAVAVVEHLGRHRRACPCRLGDLCLDGAERALASAEEHLRAEAPSLPVSSALRFGDVAEALEEVADGARLLGLGMRSRDTREDRLLGRVAETLTGLLPIPVLLADELDAGTPTRRGPGQGHGVVLAALSGDERDADVLTAADEWAGRHHAQVHLVHSLTGHEDGRDRGGPGDHRSGNPSAYLVDPPPAPGGVVTTLTYATALEAVLQAAEESDLVVVGAPSRPLSAASLTARLLRRLTRPVLIAPRAARSAP